MILVKIMAIPSAFERLRTRGPFIVEALTAKMNELMIRLQGKILGESIPTFFPTGHQTLPLRFSFTKLFGVGTKYQDAVQAGKESLSNRTAKRTLKSGAEVDYAAVQEYGVDHGWEILPFNKKALAFVLDGKAMIRRRVFHPPLEARPFMRSELQNMEGEIIAGLESAFKESLGG